MIELTKDQIGRAKTAAVKAIQRDYRFDNGDEWWLIALTAAASYLQSPWEMPNGEELNKFAAIYLEMSSGTTRSVQYCVQAALRDFVERRNAALIPSPVDPRREKIIEAITNSANEGQVIDVARTADAILAVLGKG